MSRKKRPLPLLEHVEIEALAAEGKSIVRVGEMVCFAPFCVPGDVVDLQVLKKRHSYMEACVVRFHKYSSVRQQPMCRHFGICGGCKWQMLPYEEQLKMKQQQVYDQLTRIGKVEAPPMLPILGSTKTRAYRNKLEFGCSNRRWRTKEELDAMVTSCPTPPGPAPDSPGAIGFHITGAFDKIYPIDECCLMDPLHNDIRNTIRDYAVDHGITFFDLRAQHGLLRDIMIRNSNTGEWMVLVQFHYDRPDDHDRAMALMQHVADRFPQITSLLYVDNPKCNDTFGDLDISVFSGNDHICETMGDLRFKVGPKSFYQTNTDQALRLYEVVRDFAGLSGRELVYDLYTGTGTIANFVARQARQVIGIEYVPEAVDDARTNARTNNIDNTLFFAGDMKDLLDDKFIDRYGQPDVVITDPPRAGMHGAVVQTIMRAAPQRIVYVSCNPATQARDIQLLAPMYYVTKVQPVDMFPHTPHVENVALLTLRVKN